MSSPLVLPPVFPIDVPLPLMLDPLLDTETRRPTIIGRWVRVGVRVRVRVRVRVKG